MTIEPVFYTDKDVARTLGMSVSWVKGQRFKRIHGQDHTFDLDARYIGKCARYVRAEVEAFVKNLVGE